VGFDPIGNRLVAEVQEAPDPSKVETIHIQREGFPAHFIGVPDVFGLRRVFAVACLAQVPLAPRRIAPNLDLTLSSLTVGTLAHAPILPIPCAFATPRLLLFHNAC